MLNLILYLEMVKSSNNLIKNIRHSDLSNFEKKIIAELNRVLDIAKERKIIDNNYNRLRRTTDPNLDGSPKKI